MFKDTCISPAAIIFDMHLLQNETRSMLENI